LERLTPEGLLDFLGFHVTDSDIIVKHMPHDPISIVHVYGRRLDSFEGFWQRNEVMACDDGASVQEFDLGTYRDRIYDEEKTKFIISNWRFIVVRRVRKGELYRALKQSEYSELTVLFKSPNDELWPKVEEISKLREERSDI